MISLDKCSGSCNFTNVLSPKICVSNKTKDIKVKVFNMISNRNEVKTMIKHISCDCKCKLDSSTCNSNQKWNNRTCQSECKIYSTCKKGYSWNTTTYVSDNGKYLKSAVNDSVMACDKIIYVMDICVNKNHKYYSNKCKSTMSRNCHNKKVRYKLNTIIYIQFY